MNKRTTGVLIILMNTICRPIPAADTLFFSLEDKNTIPCAVTNYAEIEEVYTATSDKKVYVLPVFGGTTGRLSATELRARIGDAGFSLCYPLPVGRGKSKELLRNVLQFYKQKLLADTDINYPTYMAYGRLGGLTSGWLVIYEFTDSYGQTGYIQLDIPTPSNLEAYRKKKINKLHDIAINEEEIITAYKKHRGVTSYTGPANDWHDGSKKQRNTAEDLKLLNTMKGTAGFIEVRITFNASSGWHCPVKGDYDQCRMVENTK